MNRFTSSSIVRLSALPPALAVSDVRISCGDYAAVIRAPGDGVTLVCDPPYFSASKLFGRDGTLHEFDHERLAAELRATQHRWLLTYDDVPEIRELYSSWAPLESWSLSYGMSRGRGAELLIASPW